MNKFVTVRWSLGRPVYHCTNESISDNRGYEAHKIGDKIFCITEQGVVSFGYAHKCEQCELARPGAWGEPSRRVDSTRNVILCRPCAVDYHEYWDDQWLGWEKSRG